MRGRYLQRTWQYDPTLYAPARYRRACAYEPFMPDPITGIEESFSSRTMGVVSDAERAVHRVGRDTDGALPPPSAIAAPYGVDRFVEGGGAPGRRP